MSPSTPTPNRTSGPTRRNSDQLYGYSTNEDLEAVDMSHQAYMTPRTMGQSQVVYRSTRQPSQGAINPYEYSQMPMQAQQFAPYSYSPQYGNQAYFQGQMAAGPSQPSTVGRQTQGYAQYPVAQRSPPVYQSAIQPAAQTGYSVSPGQQVLLPSDPTYVPSPRPKPRCWEHGCNGREFSTFSNLLRHQREKAGTAAKSTCPHCGLEFTRTTARNGHLASGKCKGRAGSRSKNSDAGEGSSGGG